MRRYSRRIALGLIDCLIIVIALYSALYIRFEGKIPVAYLNIFIHSIIMLMFINIVIFYLFRLYKSLWQYASINELVQIFIATVAGTTASVIFGYVFNMLLPHSVYIIAWMITFFLIGSSRFSYRLLRRYRSYLNHFPDKNGESGAKTRVMIVGAGEAGSMLIKELREHKELKAEPIVAVDDDRMKYKSSINGVPIEGGRGKIIELAEKYKIDEIIIAIPSAKKREISEILKICKETQCRLKILPGVYELINGRVNIKNIRDVSIEDLLGRDEVKLDTEGIAEYIKGKTVLVTGGGGSIGSELCRQIAGFRPKKLIIFDIYENNAYDLQNELLYTYKNKINLEVLIGSIRDKERLTQVFEKYRPEVVFHAAAHKHVPLMEANPAEAVKNNIFGTINVAFCANEFGTKKFVLISSDKAVNPTNIMGSTKRVAEMVIQSLDKLSKTEFAAVRFGNVLGSNGSVVPLFKKQIANGGPVTVTHPEVVRYFMTIPEAAQLVLQAGALAKGGEIFILDMGQPVKIAELAKDLIKLSGLRPGIDIKIEYTGLRPGEKLYEELLLAEEGLQKTAHEKIYVGKPLNLSLHEVMLNIRKLEENLDDADKLRWCIARIVTTYKYNEEVAAARLDMLAGAHAK